MTEPQMILPPKAFDLFYGEPGSGKSDAIKHCLIQALRENPGKKVKLVVGDGSTSTYDSLIQAGKAELCLFPQRHWPLDTLDKLTQGWWLEDPNDPTSKLVKPKSAEDLTRFCASTWEGASVMGRYLLGSVKGGLAQQAAAGIQMGPDPIVKITMAEYDNQGKLKDGPETSFGTNGTAHYMAAQGHLVDFIGRCRSLPGHHWWTAHEVIMDDHVNIGDLKNPVKIKKQQVLGVPEVAGKALGPIIQRIFDQTLHFQTMSKQVKGEEKNDLGKEDVENELFYRFYTQDHWPQMGAMNVKYKACTRDVGKDFPHFFDGDRGVGIMNYYKTLRAAKEAEIAKLKEL